MATITTSHPLDEPVSLTADDARELARLLVLLIREQPAVAAEITATLRHLQQRAVQPPIETDRRKLILKARAVFSERKRRAQFFKRILFDEHAWDMLLALYITDFAGGRQTIT